MVRIGVWLPCWVAHLPSLNILFVINDLYTRGIYGNPRAGRSCSLREWGRCSRAVSPSGVMVMIVALACLIIRFRTFVFLVAPLILSGRLCPSDRCQVDRAPAWADLAHLEEPYAAGLSLLGVRARGVPAWRPSHSSGKPDGPVYL